MMFDDDDFDFPDKWEDQWPPLLLMVGFFSFVYGVFALLEFFFN
jgi:hypothetical protein